MIFSRNSIPTWLTLSRIYLLPLLIYFCYLDNESLRFLGGWLVAATALTDFFDGWLARKWNAVSVYGKFLDPMADKVLVLGLLIVLTHLNRIDPFAVLLFASRDLIVGAIRTIAAAENLIIDAQSMGKFKAAIQMIAVPFLVWSPQSPSLSWINSISVGVLWFSVILSIISAYNYARMFLNSKQ